MPAMPRSFPEHGWRMFLRRSGVSQVSRFEISGCTRNRRSFPERLWCISFVSGHAAPAGIRRLTAERDWQGLPTLTKTSNVLLMRGRREPPLPYRGRDMPYNLESLELCSVSRCINPWSFLKAGAVIGFLRGLDSSTLYRAGQARVRRVRRDVVQCQNTYLRRAV